MEVARITDAFQPLELTSLPLPLCPEGGLLIKILYGGICHSDLHNIDDETDLGNGKVFRVRDVLGEKYKGLILGHEISGEIIQIGKEVSQECHLKVGDTVLVYPWRGCQNCEACTEGETRLCENNKGGATDIGQGTLGGGFASYIALPEWELVVRLPKNIDPMIGCMLPCSASTAYCAILKTRPSLELAVRIRGFANLLLIGAGGLGLWALVLMKSVFCDQNVKVICADVEDEKIKTATDHGADDAILWKKTSTADELANLTTMSGYNKIDAVIDFVGNPKTVSTGLASLHNGGTLVSIGLNGGEVLVSIPSLISRSISLQGMRVSSIQKVRDLVELLAVQNLEKYPPVEVISLQEVNETLDRMRQGSLKGRCIIKHRHTEN